MITKALFLGSKKLGFELFKSLYLTDDRVQWAILCPPDLNDTRTYFNEFSDFARSHNIDLIVANSPDMVVEFARNFSPCVMIVNGYYRILPTELFDLVSHGVWGIHNSLLPKYRGGSPLVWQLINCEPEVGSTFFKFSKGMDDGPVLDQVRVSNKTNLTISEAGDLIEREWLERMPNLWKQFIGGEVDAYEQDHSKATYCAQRQDFDGGITWSLSANQVDAFIKAQSSPYPRAWFVYEDHQIRVVRHEIDPRTIYGSAGQVFERGEQYVTVCCGGDTGIKLIELEIEGQKKAAADVLRTIKGRLC